MKHIGKLAILGAVLAASAPFASATPITGSLGIVGFTATSVAGGVDFSGTGFAGSGAPGSASNTLGYAAGDLVTLPSHFLFLSPDVTLFLASGLGNTASFTITGAVAESDFNGIEDVTGSGYFNQTILGTPLAQTDGTFKLSVSDSGQSGAFEITSKVSPAPEPSSLMLLGTGLVGAAGAFLRKRVTA